MNKTTNFGFNLPSKAQDEIVDIAVLNENFVEIDRLLAEGGTGGGESVSQDVIVTISSNEWSRATAGVDYTCIKNFNGGNATKIDFGLPVPTTRANADEISNANIIVTQIQNYPTYNRTTIEFSAKSKPTSDIQIALNGVGAVL